MELYITTKNFVDKTDKRRYVENDYFPHNANKEVSDERIDELLDAEYITFANEPKETNEDVAEEYPKSVGGGYYQLSDGSKVQGKEKAIEAEQALKEGE